jgi:colanic acid/amylovoran biosynthesis protein
MVIIGPGALDSNKGDQALVAEAIRFSRLVYPEARIYVENDTPDGHSDELRATKSLGVLPTPALLASPRTGKLQRTGFRDSRWASIRMAAKAVIDFVKSLFVLLTCRRLPYLSGLALSSEQRSTLQALSRASLYVVKGGGFIYSYKGIAGCYYLYYQLYRFLVAHTLGVPVVVLPNSFGPFENHGTRVFARLVLDRCKAIACRESRSAHTLRTLGIRESLIEEVPDMGWTVRPEHEAVAEEFRAFRESKQPNRLVGLTVRPWRFPGHPDPQKAWRTYVRCIREFVTWLNHAGYVPVLFSHSIGPHDHEDDRIAIREVVQDMSQRCKVISGDFSPGQLKAMYRLVDFFVGTRMHSVIFALGMNVPSIAISYQGPKAPGIMAECGLSEFVLDISSVETSALIERFESLVAREMAIRERIASAVENFTTSLEKWMYETAVVLQRKL